MNKPTRLRVKLSPDMHLAVAVAEAQTGIARPQLALNALRDYLRRKGAAR